MSLVSAFFGFVVFSVRVLLILRVCVCVCVCVCVSACLVFLCSACFFGMLFVMLGLSFLHCSVLMGTFSGGRLGMANRGGVNMFFVFSHNRVVWVKQALSLQARIFMTVSLLSK